MRLTRFCIYLFLKVVSILLFYRQVAQYLVPKVRSIAGSGSTKPTYIRFLTGMKAYSQIFSVKTENNTLVTCSFLN